MIVFRSHVQPIGNTYPFKDHMPPKAIETRPTGVMLETKLAIQSVNKQRDWLKTSVSKRFDKF